jgi:hypothetical protein
MAYAVFFALLLLITLLASYIKIESNRKKVIEAKRKLFHERATHVNLCLKAKLNELLDAKLIRPKYISRIQAIVNNFFVVQTYTEENLQRLEDTTRLLINTLSNELIKTNQTSFIQPLIDNMERFVAELPQQGIHYNREFYINTLPMLIALLESKSYTQPFDIDKNNKNNLHIISDTTLNHDVSVV